MNNKFDEMAIGMAQLAACRSALQIFGFAGMALAMMVAQPASADSLQLGPLIELSRPNAVGTCDDGFSLPGPWTLDDATEPFVVVNPVNPKNIVAAWWQGPLQNIIAATSFDGGRTWQQVPVPFSICSGGPFLGTGDPWLSFAPNGDLYASSVAGDALDFRGIAVTKSSDGGLHWSPAALVYGQTDAYTLGDKPSITADPSNPRFVYVVWDVYDGINGGGDHTFFARTTDGGQTWEPPRAIYTPGGYNGASGHQIVVLPNGTLVCLFGAAIFNDATGNQELSVALIRSTDRGQTWSGRVGVAQQFSLPDVDPENGTAITGGLPAVATDRRNGNLYAVWEDSRFSKGSYNDIAFSQSADGGLNWSSPIRINQTPRNVPPANRQAFLPSIAVTADGTIGVGYYDLRFNDRRPGLPTDYWLVQCQPSRRAPATSPANWGDEVRLTSKSFDMEKAGAPLFDYFVGDYEGLTAVGNDFVSSFCQVDRDNVTSIFFRRIGR